LIVNVRHANSHAGKIGATLQISTRFAHNRARGTPPGWITGLYNQAATRNRMGNTFGKSAHPQRPAAFAVFFLDSRAIMNERQVTGKISPVSAYDALNPGTCICNTISAE
jgi:hypothetical protein